MDMYLHMKHHDRATNRRYTSERNSESMKETSGYGSYYFVWSAFMKIKKTMNINMIFLSSEESDKWNCQHIHEINIIKTAVYKIKNHEIFDMTN